jgi:Tfp pilus assembly protein PilZ
MAEFDSQIGKFQVTARLFNYINDLSSDKQFILYKQLIKGDVDTQLFKLIIDMTEEEKIQLLEKLGEISHEEEPIKTINIDEDESFMRENPRKICSIPVKYKVGNRVFKSYIFDISEVGAFIETNDGFPIGQKILMQLKLPDYPEAFELRGRIARSGPKGIGVRFYSLTQTQEQIVHTFIEKKNEVR